MDNKYGIAVLLILALVSVAGLLVISKQQSTGFVSQEREDAAGLPVSPYAYGQTGASCRQDSDCDWICTPQDAWCGCLEHKCAYYVRQR